MLYLANFVHSAAHEFCIIWNASASHVGQRTGSAKSAAKTKEEMVHKGGSEVQRFSVLLLQKQQEHRANVFYGFSEAFSGAEIYWYWFFWRIGVALNLLVDSGFRDG